MVGKMGCKRKRREEGKARRGRRGAWLEGREPGAQARVHDIQAHCSHYCSYSAKLSLLFTGQMGIKTLILQGCFEEQRKHL